MDKNLYTFKVGERTMEVFFSEEGEYSEMYDSENIDKTGFTFDTKKELISFINQLTDIVEEKWQQ